MNTLKVALNYHRQGLSVVPTWDTGKHPFVEWMPYQTNQASEKQVKEWFNNGSNNKICIITGELSNIAVVDADNEKALEWCDFNLPLTVNTDFHGKERAPNFL